MKFGISYATNFLKEVRLEMKKVNWPTRKELIRYTLVVVGVSTAIALYLGGLDYIFALIMQKIILR
jgi:preprotein translocase subunit SecE